MKKTSLKKFTQLLYAALGRGLLIFLVFGLAMVSYAVVFPTVEPQPASGVVGLYVGPTPQSYDGNDAANYAGTNALCNAQFSGSHVCRLDEIINTYTHASASVDGLTTIAWVNAPYLGLSEGTRRINDCRGWSADDSNGRFFAHVWNFNSGISGLQQCHATHPFACCR